MSHDGELKHTFGSEGQPPIASSQSSEQHAAVLAALTHYIDQSLLHEALEDRQRLAAKLIDLGEVYRLYQLWKAHMSGIQPFFAVKCERDHVITTLMKDLGAGFFCQNINEAKDCLALGVSPSGIAYTSGFKSPSFLRFAAELDIKLVSFDTEEDLHLVKELHPSAELLLRVETCRKIKGHQTPLRWGSSVQNSRALLQTAKNLNLNVVGVSLHVEPDINLHCAAIEVGIEDSRVVFDYGLECGHDMRLLDLGGGFEIGTFIATAKSIRTAVEKHGFTNCTVIAEPGQLMVRSATTVANQIIARRSQGPSEADEGARRSLYLSQSVWSAHSRRRENETLDSPEPLYSSETKRRASKIAGTQSALQKFEVYGSTGEFPWDVIGVWDLPDLQPGDWLVFSNIGGYFESPSIGHEERRTMHHHVYICSVPEAKQSCVKVVEKMKVIGSFFDQSLYKRT